MSGAAIPPSLKLASFNINGIKARLPRLLEWLEETRPSVACLQEIKTQDEGFPAAEFEKIGYHAIWHGQKGFNGVAILADGKKPVEVQRGLAGEPEDEHSRYLEADVFGLRVVCIYLPNGNPQPGPKFDYKLRWMERLRARMAEIWAQEVPAAVLGDYNVIPRDNEADLDDLPADVREKLVVTPVDTLAEALAVTIRDTTLRDGRLFFGQRVSPVSELAH